MTYNIVKPDDLIQHCMRFYNEGWGYIYGASGQIWTQAQQDAATDEQIRLYGQQWVGKHVIDCSGVWYLAMRELGSYMYHGSNTMWKSYTVNRGALKGGKRTDGQQLKPGSAIFTGNDQDGRNHVGIYVGDGKVLEAGGTQKGVILTAVTASKWTWWAEMKYIDYEGTAPAPGPDTKPTLRRGSAGEYVTLLQTKLIQRGYDLSPYGADGKYGSRTELAVRQFQADNMDPSGKPLAVDGICGPNTWAAIESGKLTTYTVTVKHLSKTVAEDLVTKFGGVMTAEEV